MLPFTMNLSKLLKKTKVTPFLTNWAPVPLKPEFTGSFMSIPETQTYRGKFRKTLDPSTAIDFIIFLNCTLVTWAAKLHWILCSPPFPEETGEMWILIFIPSKIFLDTVQFGKGEFWIYSLFDGYVLCYLSGQLEKESWWMQILNGDLTRYTEIINMFPSDDLIKMWSVWGMWGRKPGEAENVAEKQMIQEARRLKFFCTYCTHSNTCFAILLIPDCQDNEEENQVVWSLSKVQKKLHECCVVSLTLTLCLATQKL